MFWLKIHFFIMQYTHVLEKYKCIVLSFKNNAKGTDGWTGLLEAKSQDALMFS